MKQLMTIEGVGQKMAERMVEHRNDKGGFASLEDLMLIQGMKPKLYEKVKEQVTLGRVSKGVKASKKPALISNSELDSVMRDYSGEPGVRAVQEEALKYANAHPEQLRSWLKRARKAYWLPKLGTGANPQIGFVESAREKTGNLDTYNNQHINNWRFQVKAEWHLNHLVFNRDELMVNREFLRQSLMRERILDKVKEAYFDRRRLQIQKQFDSFLDTQSKIESVLKLEEFTAELDGLTGGWFSQQL